jgi:hypothetical protein
VRSRPTTAWNIKSLKKERKEMARIIRGSGKEKGQALLVAMIFLMALTFLGFGLVTIATIDMHSARNMRLAEEALTVAEQGALIGMAWASNPSNKLATKDMGFNYSTPVQIGKHSWCDVKVILGGPGPVPEGEMFIPELVDVMIIVQSEGWVGETTVGILAGNKPKIMRTVEIQASIRVPA